MVATVRCAPRAGGSGGAVQRGCSRTVTWAITMLTGNNARIIAVAHSTLKPKNHTISTAAANDATPTAIARGGSADCGVGCSTESSKRKVDMLTGAPYVRGDAQEDLLPIMT